MPSIKSRMPSGIKSQEVKTGFEAYDGPIPDKRGFYRAKITSMKWGKNSGGSYGFSIVANLEAASGDPKDHAQFDGMPMFSHSIITETADGSALKEGSVNNLSNLYAALGAKDDPDVIVAKGDPDESKLDVLKVDGKNPVGRYINIDLGFETYNGERRPTISGIFADKSDSGPSKAGKSASKFVADEEEPEDEDESDLTEDDEEFAAREEELNAMTLAKIKAVAKELKVTGKNKAELIDAILDAEFPEDGAAALDEEDEEEDDEVDEEEVDDEEEDDEEEDEEEDEEDDGRAEREEELSGFNRVALKKILAEVDSSFRVLKKHSDDDLREAILAAEFDEDETPF